MHDHEPQPTSDPTHPPQRSASSQTPALPPAETSYLARIVDTLQRRLDTRLLGVYLFGSAAYGEYEAGQSDLDVQAVVATPLSEHELLDVAGRLAHARLPCPARKLEFVLYTQAAINPAARHPQFALNYNTGADQPDHVTISPADESSHWFLLDIAMGRELGRSLSGPAPQQVFAPIPRLWQLAAIGDSLAWHRAHEAVSSNSVLNACRGWRYAVTGVHGSKLAGAAWAQQQPGCPAVVEEAVHGRYASHTLDAGAVAELMQMIERTLDVAIRAEQRRV